MSNVFKELLLEGALCDTVIKVADVELRAHRIILCSCSSFFRDLFCSEPSTSGQKVYNISDVTPNVMGLILEYAYTNSVVVTDNNVLELLAGAERLSVKDIIQACCDFLQEKLCSNNCISIWNLAGYYKYPELMRQAYLYMLQHFEEVAGHSLEFLHLSVEQLTDLIEENVLNVKQESAVFEAILRWINYAHEERKVHLAKLMSKVRLLLMPIQYLTDRVSKEALVRNNMQCVNMVISSMKTLRESNIERPLSLYRLPSHVLLAIGGFVDYVATAKIELYNMRTDRWMTVHNNGNALPEFCGCVYLNGFVYCIGGYDNELYLSSVQKFSLSTQIWHEVGSMHMARCYVTVAVLNGHIYAMGGCSKYETLKSAERFEPETNQWTPIAPMHEPRADAGAATLHGKVYICGGFITNNPLSSAECYNPDANQWTLITPMDTLRNAPGVIAYNDQIYVIGGYEGTRHLSSVTSYNPQSQQWSPAAPMYHCRSNFGIAVLEEKVFVVGGILNDNAELCSAVECYDGKTNRWQNVQNLEMPRGAVRCCVVERIPYAVTYLS
ncbi:kelch-like protein 10 [Melanotaenia boesemani]|uniref:kelch-like protein 10 n=1 Tax=Melanotaenia boesemani TaxID=1250792 RepID=UPI001C042CC8|nr:kelch-like protein 10 [Melanotaenia boesemani]